MEVWQFLDIRQSEWIKDRFKKNIALQAVKRTTRRSHDWPPPWAPPELPPNEAILSSAHWGNSRLDGIPWTQFHPYEIPSSSMLVADISMFKLEMFADIPTAITANLPTHISHSVPGIEAVRRGGDEPNPTWLSRKVPRLFWFLWKPSIYWGFSMAMVDLQLVFHKNS